ncbi:MAG: hypothetical protein JWQ18_494 [Conexibacter sp.]|nr:hypothetical protein [Conexibacter sp.]
MSSRQEEKERRRREREEREAAEAGKVASKRRLQLVAGAVIGLVAIAAVVAAIASSGGGGSKADAGSSYGSAKIPARKTTNFDAAVKASGCTFKTFTSEGRTHLPSDTAVNNSYKTNPPTSGNHRPTPAQDGVYAPGNTPDKENFVHTLEHGRIELQYSPKAPKVVQDQLNALFNEPVKGANGYHMLLFENNTNMPYEVAATAWTHLIGCTTVTDKTWDALRAFRDRFVDKGPELIP